MTSSLLLTDTPKRITRGNQSLIRHTLADRNRNVLAPYVGQTCFLRGTIQRHSHRNGRLFLCLSDVDLCTFNESRLPHAERTYIPIDHCWEEVGKGQSVPPVGDKVVNFCTVIEYQKLDGDTSYGCSPLGTIGISLGLQYTADRVLTRIEEAEGAVSYSGIAQSEFNSFIKSLKRGYLLPDEVDVEAHRIYISTGDVSIKHLISHTQVILKKVLKHLKRGRIDHVDRIFNHLQTNGLATIEGYITH